MTQGVLLISHGTVDDLADLPAFLTNIRRGHAPPPDLVHEVRRRYEAIGGRSPLNALCGELACQLEGRLRLPVRACQRLWKPTAEEGLRALVDAGVRDIAVVPLAQHSAPLYGEAVQKAADALLAQGGPALRLRPAANWGQEPALLDAYADALRSTVAAAGAKDETLVVMTAHSLPVAVVRSGDPYEQEVRTSAAAIAARLGAAMPRWVLAFQSQGMSSGPGGRPVEWLGPDLDTTFAEARRSGARSVVLAPIGFLADHVEILYDLDIEAKANLEAMGLRYARTPSLNATPAMVTAVEGVARRLLETS